MSNVRVRWAFCAADLSKNGHIDHLDSEVAQAYEREGRLSIEPLPVAEDVPAKPKK